MADPHWTGYVGMISGIIGSATGLVGAILGIKGYRKSNQLKSLDLRVVLKKAITDVRADHKALRKKMVEGNKSRESVAAMLGVLSSSWMNNWKNEFEKDQSTVKKISIELPEIDGGYEKLNPNDLEKKLIEVHGIRAEIRSLSNKYDKEMAEDDERRRQHNEDRRAQLNMQSRTKPPIG